MSTPQLDSAANHPTLSGAALAVACGKEAISYLPRGGEAAAAPPVRHSAKECYRCKKSFIRPYAPSAKFCSKSCASSHANIARKDHTPETLMRRFWAKVDTTAGFGPNGNCWRWTARVDGRGYGEIKIAGKYKKAHRLSLFGPLDMANPLFACHTCDNPACVRPDHLFAGAAVDNVRDMHAKGRFIPRRRKK